MADAAVLASTRKYARPGVVRAVARRAVAAAGRLRVEQIYVPRSPQAQPWRAALIDAPTQAGKTFKTLEVLAAKLRELALDGDTLVLFVTQANSVASVQQLMARARAHAGFAASVPPERVTRCEQLADVADAITGDDEDGGGDADDVVDERGSRMAVGFWNSRCTAAMHDFVRATSGAWSNIIIVEDEADQGGMHGVRERLGFVRRVERAAGPDCVVRLILITATVANLSKSVCQVAASNPVKFRDGVVARIVHDPVVEHYFAEPHERYVGPSWFVRSGNVVRLRMGDTRPGADAEEAQQEREDRVTRALGELPDAAKELCLIVSSTRTSEHASLVQRLFASTVGFNVAVELNGTNSRNFTVRYAAPSGRVASWQVPYSALEVLADRGQLASMRHERRTVDTGIETRDDLSLPAVLQAALFMGTDAEERIARNAEPSEYIRLCALAAAIATMPRTLKRPRGFPAQPRVALVAGHLAGRGITIQSPGADFACTAFCFVDTKDTAQRGATNSQRFGRACGMLKEIYTTEGRAPVLIATEAMLADALANERALVDKAAEIPDGTTVSLKDLISKAEWDAALKKAKKDVKDIGATKAAAKPNLRMQLLAEYYKLSNGGQRTMTLDEIKKCKSIMEEIFAKDHRKSHEALLKKKLIQVVGKLEYRLTQAGIDMAIEAIELAQ